MDKLLLFSFVAILFGCTSAEKKENSTYFAGEIVNPTSNYVVLYKGEVVIDTAELDNKNRFSFSLDNISEGLYNFKHAPEYQYVHLEMGDSLMARLNTVAFDESLVFSGKGEAINNFLLELFLAKEEEEKKVSKDFYNLKPKDFSAQINTLINEKMENLEAVNLESPLSKAAYEIAETSIKYSYYNYKEKYPFKYKKHTKGNKFKELPDDFYSYRKNLNFNNSKLNYLRPYYDFMKSHFGNLSYATCSHKCAVENGIVVKNHLHFNKHKLKLIDSIVIEKELKDNLYRNVAINYLLKVNDTKENNEIFIKRFHELSKSNRHIEEIDNLYSSIKKLQPKNKIPDIKVVNTSGHNVSLQTISKDKKVVFYFWSDKNKKHYNNVFKQVSKLSEKSDYSFVGINVNAINDSVWKKIIKTNELDSLKQYRANNFETLTKSLLIYPLNKCIITDNTEIVNAFSDIYKSKSF